MENLALRVLARPEEPHEAVADYDIVRLQDAREVGRERWTTNPIGLTITYFAADRALSSGD